ncbi:chorismate mutase [Streptomyces sp. HNM0574]|uniref:chorismate mutase n=1 Tax=Streptomyces sp. HNM0574 TaxID=2714954 RepID=UPI00146C087D|nr:chorismate mutase [Streptomyces sp. HNM0574]NLU68812.1 chorismate mutase [Streptomyces sp. HNM0574]
MKTGDAPAPDPLLRELRQDLDAIDTILLNALLLRHQATRRVGRVKGDRDIPVMQPDRVRVVLRRATEFALEHGMSPSALQDVFTTLISDACRREEGEPAHAGPAEAGQAAQDRIEALVGSIENRAHTAD